MTDRNSETYKAWVERKWQRREEEMRAKQRLKMTVAD